MDNETQYFTKDDTSGEYVEYQRPTFVERLGDHAENEAFQGIENLNGLAETHVNTVSELTALKSAQPTIPDEYNFPQAPEGVTVDEQAQTEFAALAREMNLTQENLDKIIAFDMARAERYMKASGESFDQAKLTAETALKERWGNKYSVNSEMAKAGFRKVLGGFEDGDEIEKSLAATGLLDNAEFKRLFRLIGEKTSEDVFVRGTESSGDDGIPRGPDGKPILTYDKSDMPGDARK